MPEIEKNKRLRFSASGFYREHKRAFSRATLTSLAATVVDFSTLYGLTEFARVYYVASTAIGAFCGALTNFTLNRYWAFDSRHSHVATQGMRYAIVSAGSLVLNTALVFCFTEFGHLRYLVSKVFVSLLVGWLWNYPMHRYYVFPDAKTPT